MYKIFNKIYVLILLLKIIKINQDILIINLIDISNKFGIILNTQLKILFYFLIYRYKTYNNKLIKNFSGFIVFYIYIYINLKYFLLYFVYFIIYLITL